MYAIPLQRGVATHGDTKSTYQGQLLAQFPLL
jgi:hypothetical protein